jgi:sugar/nucleoside kinase (ribokinase family)
MRGAIMDITITGDIMWYIQACRNKLPRRNRTSIVSRETAIVGGSAINIAAHLAALGHRPNLVSVVGRSDHPVISSHLNSKGVGASGLIGHDGATNLLIAFADDSAAQSVFVGDKMEPEILHEVAEKLSHGAPLVYGGSRSSDFRAAVFEQVQSGNEIFVFAPSYSLFEHPAPEVARFVERADICAFNRVEFRHFVQLMGGQHNALRMARCCIVTLAGKGAIVYADGKRYLAESTSGSQVDVIGAGDYFLAAFLSAWLRDKNRDSFAALDAAAAAAGRFVRDQSGD